MEVFACVTDDDYDAWRRVRIAVIPGERCDTVAQMRRQDSPERLLVSTVGDELKASGKGGKVVGISLKDRSAILPAGRKADGAYWFDGQSGSFVSSTYYFAELPAWVREFNAARPVEQYAGTDE